MKQIIKIFSFFLVFIIFFTLAGGLFKLKTGNDEMLDKAYYFYHEPRNTIETIFVGPSVVYHGVNPIELYKDYGLSTYVIGSPVQPVMMSYYWVKEAFRLHSETLSTIVFDVSELRQRPGLSRYQSAIDYMHFSPIKLEALRSMTNNLNSFLSIFISLFEYHDRWLELTKSDFVYEKDINTRGYLLRTKNVYSSNNNDYNGLQYYSTYVNPSAEQARLDDEAVTYFEKLVAFCREKHLKLVLIKTPTMEPQWNDSLHKAIAELADKNDLLFFDFNYSPFIDELNIVYTIDHYDPYHLNYYGAKKLSNWLGKYLVEECLNHDFRDKNGYEYLNKQLLTNETYYKLSLDLSQLWDITKYLQMSINTIPNIMVFISAKEDASASLLSSQREMMNKIGLSKTIELNYRDSYLAVLTKENVIAEILQKASSARQSENFSANSPIEAEIQDTSIRYSGTTPTGEPFEIISGGFYDGNRSSIMINGKEYSKNGRGFNIVVYDFIEKKVIDSASFDTFAESYREKPLEEQFKEAKSVGTPYSELNEKIKGLYLYDRSYGNLKITKLWDYFGEKGDPFIYLDPFLNNSGYMLFFSVKNEASRMMDQNVRNAFAEIGLQKLSEISYRDSYIGIIDDGKVIYEEKSDDSEPLVYQFYGIAVQSGGLDSGNISSIKIEGKEESPNENGLNIVIYDKELDIVVTKQAFDFFAEKMVLQ